MSISPWRILNQLLLQACNETHARKGEYFGCTLWGVTPSMESVGCVKFILPFAVSGSMRKFRPQEILLTIIGPALVSGHDFSRAENGSVSNGLSAAEGDCGTLRFLRMSMSFRKRPLITLEGNIRVPQSQLRPDRIPDHRHRRPRRDKPPLPIQ